MKNFLFATIIAFIATACHSKIDGEGMATAQQEFKADAFTKIEVNCNCDLNIIPSTNSKVIVESHQNLIDNLEITTKGNNLVIKEKNSVEKYSLYNINVYTNPQLESITLGNQTKMKISGTLKSEELDFQLEDQSMLNDSFVDVKNLNLTANDQSHIVLQGTCINLNIESNDQSTVDLGSLQTVDVEFTAKDQTQLTINALKNLNGKAYDTSVVNYFGDPNKDTTEKDRAIIQKK